MNFGDQLWRYFLSYDMFLFVYVDHNAFCTIYNNHNDNNRKTLTTVKARVHPPSLERCELSICRNIFNKVSLWKIVQHTGNKVQNSSKEEFLAVLLSYPTLP
jgi:hypothetical protein